MFPKNIMPLTDRKFEGLSPGTVRIIIVEDEGLVCWSLSSILRKTGYSITVVTTGEEAINELSANHYDLVITDLKLPHADGFEVASFVKKSHSGLPVILISAESDQTITDHLERKVVDYFMEKPFDLDDMTSLIEECLRRFRKTMSYDTRK